MIAGNHHWTNPGPSRPRHGLLRLLARRIDHADESEKDEFLLDAFVSLFVLEGVGRQDARGDAEGAQGLAREVFIGLHNLCAALLRQWPFFLPESFVRAAREQHVRRAFGKNEHTLLLLA